MPNRPTLVVDFDGVLHSYISPWIDERTIPDPPIPGALQWLYDCAKVFEVVIYSSRSKSREGTMAMFEWIVEHARLEFGSDHPLAQNNPGYYPIKFSSQKPAAFLTIDDRAVCFQGNFKEVAPEKLRDFRPWNKGGWKDERLKQLVVVTEMAVAPGAYDAEPYFHGMANGLILALHIMEGGRGSPHYLETPERWRRDDAGPIRPTEQHREMLRGSGEDPAQDRGAGPG